MSKMLLDRARPAIEFKQHMFLKILWIYHVINFSLTDVLRFSFRSRWYKMLDLQSETPCVCPPNFTFPVGVCLSVDYGTQNLPRQRGRLRDFCRTLIRYT